MNEATRLALSGSPHGTVVLADEQTAGIGRLGRSWISEPEVGIYCSMLLRLPLSPASLPVAALVLGLAVAEAIEKATLVSCDLRWPNDILINERKAAGILAQLANGCVVAGIGINVNQKSFPGGLRTPATSLYLESGGKIQSREMILVNLLQSVDYFCSMLIHQGSSSIIRAFSRASSYAINRRISVEESGENGTTAGLDDQGFLLVQFDSGRVQRLAAGGIRPVV